MIPSTGTNILVFRTSEEVRYRWKRDFVGEVLIPDASYNIQTHLETEGFFSVKVHPLGRNHTGAIGRGMFMVETVV